LFIQDKDGLKVFQLSIKEKPTYKKDFKNPKAGKHGREELDQTNKECVSHTLALPFTFRSILMQKKKLWKLKYFTMQKYNLPKIL